MTQTEQSTPTGFDWKSLKLDTMIMVDTEASGQSPSVGSLIAIGACVVTDPSKVFYKEIQPEADKPWSMDAQKVHGLTQGHLARNGEYPKQAMWDFEGWLDSVKGETRLTFVGWNATFDWMWIEDYFRKYLGRNPFGISGLDLKAFYLGKHWPETYKWSDTAKRPVYDRYPVGSPHTHNALDDAIEQAELARRLMEIGEFQGVKALPLDRKKKR